MERKIVGVNGSLRNRESYRTGLFVDCDECAEHGIKVCPILKLRVKNHRDLCVAAMPISRKAMCPLG